MLTWSEPLPLHLHAHYRRRQDKTLQELYVSGLGITGDVPDVIPEGSPLRVVFDVMLWEAMPQILVGMRSGVSLALVIVVVAEMFIGSTDGLGQRVIVAQSLFESGLMYGVIFVAGALGYLLNLSFLLLEKRFIHWAGK